MFMVRDVRHMSEADRRELADALRDEGAAADEAVDEPRRLDQMFSVRLGPDLAAALRDLANVRGATVSELLREAALALLRAEHEPRPGVVVERLVVRSGGLPITYDAGTGPTTGQPSPRRVDDELSISGTSEVVGR